MVHRFRKTAAHTAPIHQREAPEHQIIQGKNPTVGCGPQEESHPLRNLNFPNPLPREARRRCTPNLITERPMGSIAPTETISLFPTLPLN